MWIEKLLLKKTWFSNLKVPKEKSTRPEGIIDKFCQTIIEQLTAIFIKVFQMLHKERRLLNSFYKAGTMLAIKSGKNTTIKEVIGQHN